MDGFKKLFLANREMRFDGHFKGKGILKNVLSSEVNIGRKEGRKEGTCLFDINIKHNTEIYIGKIISGDSH